MEPGDIREGMRFRLKPGAVWHHNGHDLEGGAVLTVLALSDPDPDAYRPEGKHRVVVKVDGMDGTSTGDKTYLLAKADLLTSMEFAEVDPDRVWRETKRAFVQEAVDALHAKQHAPGLHVGGADVAA